MDINWIVDSPFEALPVGDPHAVAVSIDGTDNMTYAQLRERRNRYASLLLDAGLQHGERVGIVMHNSLDYLALYFAIARLGAIAVRINFRLAPAEFAHILTDAGCSTVVFHASKADQLGPIRGDVGVRRWLCMPEGSLPTPPWAQRPDVDAASSADPAVPRPQATDPVMILYTSGTTGKPKGSVWTHENSLWAAAMQALGWGYTPGTVALSLGPMHHVIALEAMLLPALLVHGGMVLLSTGAMNVDRLIAAVRNSGATNIWVPPFMLYELARKEDLDKSLLPTLKLIMSGGDPVQPWALAAVQTKLPGVAIQQGYGLTEGGSMVSILDPAEVMKHPDSVGRPFPLTQIRVMRDEQQQAGPDEIGEVWVSSPAVSGIYWNQPEASRATFAGGWCRTGDQGRITPDGQLVLTGRSKDMIRSGGENIYPAEIEAVLASHEGVAGVAVIAVPDAKYLEVGCAVILLRNRDQDTAALEASLRALIESKVARYKCPKHYAFVLEFPLNQTGKVLKRVLREQHAGLGSVPGQRSH